MRLLGLIGLVGVMLTGQVAPAAAEDGYDLWLRYERAGDSDLSAYRGQVERVVVEGEGATLDAIRAELETGLAGLLGRDIRVSRRGGGDNMLVVGTPETSPIIARLDLDGLDAGPESYVIRTMSDRGRAMTVVAGSDEVGALYGTFALLQMMSAGEDIAELDIAESPAVDRRLLNHWDNLDRYVERGYAGQSLWDWHTLPGYINQRYMDYARANASIGINGTSLTNVNADAQVLTPQYLEKAAALADVFRPYGIRVYLTARFSAPMEIGGLETADPLDEDVRAWWATKTDEIYEYIPDFGGFLVKANSEGQPGPQDYDRTHAEGANMLADAVAPHDGIVMWRAFVYTADEDVDRAREAYDEFVPLDGEFRDNVMVQVKNGPIDFQPREPISPLFGATEETPLMLELQITKEYLGFATHLAYLAPMWEEVLDTDTYVNGEGSTVASVIDGSLDDYELTGMAGVANTGTDRNWSGSHFDQANWYAFGRLAWDPTLSSEEIARQWAAMTFSEDDAFLGAVTDMMMGSREAVVDYMTPLGLTHLMATGHHYGPGPWVDDLGRPDWNPTYYHRADEEGIGFDRTQSGSNAVEQYAEPLREKYSDPETTPENLLLWFHHLPWDYELDNGDTLWEGLVAHYSRGVEKVEAMQETWESLAAHVDERRHDEVSQFLAIQADEARWWRNASLAYFMDVSGRDLPAGYDAPPESLDYYKSLNFPSAPGNGR